MTFSLYFLQEYVEAVLERARTEINQKEEWLRRSENEDSTGGHCKVVVRQRVEETARLVP